MQEMLTPSTAPLSIVEYRALARDAYDHGFDCADAETLAGALLALCDEHERRREMLDTVHRQIDELVRELAIFALAADPMSVAKARKACTPLPREMPSGEIERR